VRYWVGITDFDWFRFLAARPELPEVNFWQPSAGRRPVTLEEGALVLFSSARRRAAGSWAVGSS